MRVRANLDLCEGYANCMIAAPDIFTIDDDGVVVVLEPNPSEEARDVAEEAVRSCPVSALALEED